MARLARVSISLKLWQQWMTQGHQSGGFKCIEGLPEGAEFLYFSRDGYHKFGDLSLVFRHDSFEDVELGQIVPELRVMFETFHLPEGMG